MHASGYVCICIASYVNGFWKLIQNLFYFIVYTNYVHAFPLYMQCAMPLLHGCHADSANRFAFPEGILPICKVAAETIGFIEGTK